jgi:hypothetical protein
MGSLSLRHESLLLDVLHSSTEGGIVVLVRSIIFAPFHPLPVISKFLGCDTTRLSDTLLLFLLQNLHFSMETAAPQMSASTAPEDDRSAGSGGVPEDTSVSSGMDETKATGARKVVESLGSRCSKWTVLALVIIVAASAGSATFIYTSNNEHDSFEAQVSNAPRRSFAELLERTSIVTEKNPLTHPSMT